MLSSQRENGLVGDSQDSFIEPALEHCMKIQRKSGVNGWKESCLWQLIRVVPPRSFGPLWMKGFFYYKKIKILFIRPFN